MYRIPRAVHFMNLAVEHAKRSTCARLNVGCLVSYSKDIVTLTHNGPPRGQPHCTGRMCPGPGGTCERSTHAEMNALLKIQELLPTSFSLDLFVTHSPCPTCAWEIVSSRVFRRVFYQTEFRDANPLDILAKSLEVYKITPAGYITQFPTGDFIDPESLYA